MRKEVLSALIIGLFFFTAQGLSQDKGGRWEFENNGWDTATWDTVEDSATLQNQAVFGNTPPLIQGSAYLFLDSSEIHDFAKIENSPDLDFDNENIGISAWIYPIVINDVHYILNKGVQNSNPKTTNYALRLSSSGNLEFLIRDANNQAQRVTSSFTVLENQWTFVAAFYNYTASKVHMWNSSVGAPIDTLDFSQDFFSNNDPLCIGSWFRNDPDNPSIKDFEGRIDDVRISSSLEDILPGMTSLELLSEGKLNLFHLHQNYPNPFNPTTTISFEIQDKAHVALQIYNNSGQLITTMLNRPLNAGVYEEFFDASNLASGIYFYRLSVKNNTKTAKMILMR